MTKARALPGIIARIHADRRGVAAVEFALCLPMIFSILIFTADYGFSIRYQLIVENAAHAGAQYAAIHGWKPDGIVAAIEESGGIPLQNNVTSFLGCVEDNVIVPSEEGSYCHTGEESGQYVRITVSYNYETILPGAWNDIDELGQVKIKASTITRIS